MYISINWIKEFVDLDGIDIYELINKFTLKTAEVEGIEEKGKDTDKIVIGEILSVQNHPNSDHLHVLKVDAGEILDIVCGAPNVRVGMKTAVALVGGHVHGEKITKAKLRGVESFGMCCSGKELGISDDHEGILDLVTDLKNGTDINELFPIKDIVFEIDNKSLTNRPDLWCHYGIARELASHANRPLKPLNRDNLESYNDLPKTTIKVDCDNLLRYTAIKVENVTEKLTPYYMQTRLYYCGMRSLNLLADLTNYIMLEVGQPMHAFDGDKVQKIEVEYAKDNQEFVTLDGQTRILKNNDIMIKSNGENVCIGGVMGGLDSEIVDTTTKLLLESAVFDSTSIRKTANRLNLRSEASNRYEKSLDPENAPIATSRFLKLLKDIDKNIKVTSSFSDNYPRQYEKIVLNVSIDYVNSYIGEKLTVNYCKDVLESIGFVVNAKDEKNMEILVPTFRATKDISIPADIVEEIARLYGYDNIKAKPLIFAIEANELDEKIKNEYKIKDEMALNGFTEIYTYIWKNKKENDKLKIEEPKGVTVVNSVLFNEIRNTLTPTLLQCIDENAKTYTDMKVFEIARVADGIVDGLTNEKKKFAYVISSITRDMKDIYFEAKRVLETLSKDLNINLSYRPKTANKNYLHPANNAEILIGDTVVGFMGLVHPVTLDVIDPKINIAVVELDVNMYLDNAKPKSKYYPTSVYQPVNLDFNFVVDNKMYYGEIENILKSYKTDLNYSFKLVDIYKDEKVLGDNYSYTFNVTVVSNTHTLSGEEIASFHSDFIKYCGEHNLKLRG
ncbi:MAG: phenylalanine--tRNA ligase subunit beta [Clostridia bacterium]|nr:phenylalanine--tRNA ligase subunit beta [Clostridia bacterium]